MKAAGPADQRPEDHLPALEDQDPAQQIHRAAEGRQSIRSKCGPARPISPPPAFSARPMSDIASPTSQTARQYFDFWKVVKTDPELDDATGRVMALTPNPDRGDCQAKSVAQVFSPRAKAEMLGWYGRRMLNAANSVWFTAAFGVTSEAGRSPSRRSAIRCASC